MGALALHVSTALQHPAANDRRQLGGLLGGLGGLGGLLGGGQEGQEAPTDGSGQGEGDVVDGMGGDDAAGGNGQEDATGKLWPSNDVLLFLPMEAMSNCPKISEISLPRPPKPILAQMPPPLRPTRRSVETPTILVWNPGTSPTPPGAWPTVARPLTPRSFLAPEAMELPLNPVRP